MLMDGIVQVQPFELNGPTRSHAKIQRDTCKIDLDVGDRMCVVLTTWYVS